MINKYIIVISAILNAILLIVLFGIIPFLWYLSMIINIFLGWYIIKILKQTEETREDLDIAFGSLEDFSDHLDELYGLETFYGDQTLKELIDHSREVINKIIDFQEKYYDVEVELETYDNIQNQELETYDNIQNQELETYDNIQNQEETATPKE